MHLIFANIGLRAKNAQWHTYDNKKAGECVGANYGQTAKTKCLCPDTRVVGDGPKA